jgi:2-polyprenyl-3-methyl-5-hydroxy-6-metoxy-1,4-benzoquinol methylase
MSTVAPLWSREAPLDGAMSGATVERWCYRGGAKSVTFDLAVSVGKPLDVVGLKGASLQDTRDYASHLRNTAERLYGPGTPRRIVESCPCCGAPTADANETARIFGVSYRACARCGHGFVREQPTQEALARLFAESEAHSQTYVDPAAAEFRIANVVAPKLTWLLELFRARSGRAPGHLVDVGAGGGHFVAAARRAGIAAEGYEVSQSSRRFAQEAFALALRESDFTTEASPTPTDVVTMWGLLEYAAEPRTLLAAARRRIAADGLLVVEVPRLNCFGTAVQRLTPDTVARHLDPTTHINTFTDASLATALVETGFEPIAVWYFGMDAYELLMQQALQLQGDGVMSALGGMIPELQSCLDHGRLCDDIVMAAVPRG